MTKKEIKVGNNIMVYIDCDNDHILHRINEENYPIIRHATVSATEAANYEEVALPDIPISKRIYNAEVERLIAERYTTGQEIQFAREQDKAGEKYVAYLAYVEECKKRATENLINRKDSVAEELW